jgi:hypothetical protein
MLKMAMEQTGTPYTSFQHVETLTICRWVSQNNFYRQIRNLVLDMRDMKPQMGKGPTIKGQVSNIKVQDCTRLTQIEESSRWYPLAGLAVLHLAKHRIPHE